MAAMLSLEKTTWLVDCCGAPTIIKNASARDMRELFRKKAREALESAREKGLNCSNEKDIKLHIEDDYIWTSFVFDTHCDETQDVYFEARRMDKIKEYDYEDLLKQRRII